MWTTNLKGYRSQSQPTTYFPQENLATFTAPSNAAVLTFTLTVTDTPSGTLGLPSAPDTVLITVAGGDFYIYLPLVLRQSP